MANLDVVTAKDLSDEFQVKLVKLDYTYMLADAGPNALKNYGLTPGERVDFGFKRLESYKVTSEMNLGAGTIAGYSFNKDQPVLVYLDRDSGIARRIGIDVVNGHMQRGWLRIPTEPTPLCSGRCVLAPYEAKGSCRCRSCMLLCAEPAKEKPPTPVEEPDAAVFEYLDTHWLMMKVGLKETTRSIVAKSADKKEFGGMSSSHATEVIGRWLTR